MRGQHSVSNPIQDSVAWRKEMQGQVAWKERQVCVVNSRDFELSEVILIAGHT